MNWVQILHTLVFFYMIINLERWWGWNRQIEENAAQNILVWEHDIQVQNWKGWNPGGRITMIFSKQDESKCHDIVVFLMNMIYGSCLFDFICPKYAP